MYLGYHECRSISLHPGRESNIGRWPIPRRRAFCNKAGAPFFYLAISIAVAVAVNFAYTESLHCIFEVYVKFTSYSFRDSASARGCRI